MKPALFVIDVQKEFYKYNASIRRGSLASDTLENIKFVESMSDMISYGALKKVLG